MSKPEKLGLALVLDGYGNDIPAEIPTTTPGIYAFTGPDFHGTLPAGVTRVPMPITYPSLYVRTVKFNALENAEKFRASLKTQTLSKYLVEPAGGATKILDEKFFAVPFKTTADTLIANTPILFQHCKSRSKHRTHHRCRRKNGHWPITLTLCLEMEARSGQSFVRALRSSRADRVQLFREDRRDQLDPFQKHRRLI